MEYFAELSVVWNSCFYAFLKGYSIITLYSGCLYVIGTYIQGVIVLTMRSYSLTDLKKGIFNLTFFKQKYASAWLHACRYFLCIHNFDDSIIYLKAVFLVWSQLNLIKICLAVFELSLIERFKSATPVLFKNNNCFNPEIAKRISADSY